MKTYRKLAYAAMVFVVLLVPLVQMPKLNATELTAQEKTLAFLSDVVMIDLSKYNVTLHHDDVSYPAEYDGAPYEKVLYKLQTDNSSFAIGECTFINGTYKYCLIGWHDVLPMYVEPLPSDIVGLAKVVLEKYQAYIGSVRYQPMRELLAPVDKTENTSVTSDSYRLDIEISPYGHQANLYWAISVGDIEETVLSMHFKDGALYTLNDRTGIFTISDTEVAVSEKEAIDIAMNSVRDFYWMTGEGVSVKADSIPRELAMAELHLQSGLGRDPFTKYPYWHVDLWLGKTYAGGVNRISVGIWADTGEVGYIKALGSGGVPSTSGSGSSPPPSSSPSSPRTFPSTPSTPESASSPSDVDTSPDPTTSPGSATPPDSTSSSQPSTLSPVIIAATVIAGLTATASAILLAKKKRR